MDDPLMKPVYETMSKETKKKGKNYMPEDVKAFYKNMLASDLQSGTIEGNKITIWIFSPKGTRINLSSRRILPRSKKNAEL